MWITAWIRNARVITNLFLAILAGPYQQLTCISGSNRSSWKDQFEQTEGIIMDFLERGGVTMLFLLFGGDRASRSAVSPYLLSGKCSSMYYWWTNAQKFWGYWETVSNSKFQSHVHSLHQNSKFKVSGVNKRADGAVFPPSEIEAEMKFLELVVVCQLTI